LEARSLLETYDTRPDNDHYEQNDNAANDQADNVNRVTQIDSAGLVKNVTAFWAGVCI
jgi:hypothetical protein